MTSTRSPPMSATMLVIGATVMLPLFLPPDVTFDKLLRALIGVALFSAAYLAEVIRGGLQAIPRGQYEAADALGLSYAQKMGLIVLPQALKLVIPGIVNSFISLFKDTSLVLIIGLFDLLGIVQQSISADAKWFSPQTAATGYFFAGADLLDVLLLHVALFGVPGAAARGRRQALRRSEDAQLFTLPPRALVQALCRARKRIFCARAASNRVRHACTSCGAATSSSGCGSSPGSSSSRSPTTHFLNHALGLFSIDWMQVVQQWRWTVTRSWPGTIVLLGGAHHRTSSLGALQARRPRRRCGCRAGSSCRSRSGSRSRSCLLPHIVNTRIAHVFFGVNDIYVYELARLWPASAIIAEPAARHRVGARLHRHPLLAAALCALPARLPLLLALAIVIPLAALGGFIVAGSSVASAIEVPRVFDNLKNLTHWPGEAATRHARVAAGRWRASSSAACWPSSSLCIAAGPIWRASFGPKVTIAYTGGPTIKVPQGPTLLEISRMTKVPHASVCGGRARCSTCRVRIDRAARSLPAADVPRERDARLHRRAAERAARLPDPARAPTSSSRGS